MSFLPYLERVAEGPVGTYHSLTKPEAQAILRALRAATELSSLVDAAYRGDGGSVHLAFLDSSAAGINAQNRELLAALGALSGAGPLGEVAVPASQNQAYGFYGTMAGFAEQAWPIAMTAIAKATSEPLESVRAFLDSNHGRHFADEVANVRSRNASIGLRAAIEAAVDRWMEMRVGRSTGRQWGVPVGVPYLVGFVIQASVNEEVV